MAGSGLFWGLIAKREEDRVGCHGLVCGICSFGEEKAYDDSVWVRIFPSFYYKTCLIETYYYMSLKLAENSFKEINFKTQFTMNIRLNELCCYIFLFILFCKST